MRPLLGALLLVAIPCAAQDWPDFRGPGGQGHAPARELPVEWSEARNIQQLGGSYSASPVLANGRIYFLAEQGVTAVIAPGVVFRRIATNTLDGATLASMAVTQGSVIVRSDKHLYRIAGSR